MHVSMRSDFMDLGIDEANIQIESKRVGMDKECGRYIQVGKELKTCVKVSGTIPAMYIDC